MESPKRELKQSDNGTLFNDSSVKDFFIRKEKELAFTQYKRMYA
eukprot:CAMPEP_0168325160 /NCGR_PEP_ID=MMETSP0213-20121227/4528_1 /TAXON_ID=151035 /ORGANISM="Euplotes harpa, Strain FSP1.4" /LENGTH=43 /DNA_ID= /DNA_START= /DNA_END= /DNA_ORIENTATION=